MSYVDVLIPALAGAALLFFPQWFTKSRGEELQKKRKNFRLYGVLLLGVALLYLAIRIAQPLMSPAEPTLEMHRTQATAADPSGWNLAASTQGGFSVLIPLPFNDFTVIGKKTALMHTVGAKSADGIKFAATKILNPEGKAPPDLARLPQDFQATGNTVSDIDPSPFSGYPAVSFTARRATDGAYLRYVKVPGGVIALTLEFPSDKADLASSYREKFLSSLQVAEPGGGR